MLLSKSKHGLLLVLAVWLVVAAPVAPAPELAAPAAAPPVHKLDVREIRLDNGLRIFVLERGASPTFAGYYQFGVGGAADPRGRTGIAHLLEHMMFKGTARVGTVDMEAEKPFLERLSKLWHELDSALDAADDPFHPSDPAKIEALRQEIEQVTAQHKKLIAKNEFDELMTRAGGVSENASTGNDTTDYFIQLPANQLETWFKLESDRLLNPVFREFWSERDVVHEERRTSTENQAEGLAAEALDRLIFLAHPYGNPVVGWPRDVARLKAEDALAYFRTYYSPSNCTMVLVGDVKTAEVERLAKKYFGGWPKREIPPLEMTAEPEQKGERRAIIEFDAQPSLWLGWATVPKGHPDHYALDVLARILGGLYSSRLDQTIVQQERIASSVSSYHDARKWSGTFVVSAYVEGEHTLDGLESAIEREIQKIQEGGVSADELERAKIRTEVSRVRSLKSNLGQAFRIGDAVGTAGTVDWLYEYERRLSAVTAADVQAAARTYLTRTRTCVVEVRKTPGASGAPAGEEAVDAHHHGGEGGGERGSQHSPGFVETMAQILAAKPLTLRIPEVGKDVQRVVLKSGATVFLKEDHAAPTVDIAFAWLGGSNTTPVAQLAPFMLASDLLTEGGTETLDPIALDARKEQLGMSFDLSVGDTQSGATFWSLERNFRESFALAMDVLMRPRLDPERLETLKGQYIDDMRRRYDYPGYGAYLIENHVLYHDHPRLGYEASKRQIEALTPQTIREIWKRYLGRDNLYVTAVGDFDRQEMLELLDETFAGWRKAEDKKRDFLARDPIVRPGVYVVEKEVSAPAVSLIQQIRVDRKAPLEDHAALEILNDILGGSDFRSRLMERLRSDEGLTYGVYSYLSHDGRPGVPGAAGAGWETKKVSVARSIAIVVDEFRKMAEGKVSPAEVTEQIDAWRNRFVFRYTNDFYSVSRLMRNELDDQPYDYDRRLLDAIQKVTPTDVERVAKRYLKPDQLSISVFGALTDEDRQALTTRYGLKVLTKAEVFRGGFDVEEP